MLFKLFHFIQSDFDETLGSKQKTPWISLNGEEIPDSQICMELLGRKFRKDFSSHLSPEEQATAYAFQMMMEEHFYWYSQVQYEGEISVIQTYNF